MMHTNYLCYLNHPVVGSELRNYTDSLQRRMEIDRRNHDVYSDHNTSWDITTVAMGMLLFHIGDGYVSEDDSHSSAGVDAAPRSLFPIHSTAGGDGESLGIYLEEIAKYFGCTCSLVTPRLFPTAENQCTRGQTPR